MRVGLTGGIATGKSTVSHMFSDLGAYLVDADVAARKVVEPGQPALYAIRELFGEEALLPNGEMNRRWVGSQVFGNSDLREQLNRIVHPRVREYMLDAMNRIETNDPQALIIVDVPLLFEKGLYPGMEKTILVYAPFPVQLARLMARNQLTEIEATERIHSQMDIERKRELATYIIDNSGDLAETQAQVEAVWNSLSCERTEKERQET